jgi:hypothetical protein
MFVLTVVADGLVGKLLPLAGQTQRVATGLVVGLCLNVVGVLLLSRPLAMAVRRVRPDLPTVVARNYGGTTVVVAISVALLGAGLAHRGTAMADQRAMREAVTRAQAWIGDRAPAPFRRNVALVDTFAIQPGAVYRSCVPSLVSGRMRNYCVIVDLTKPFPDGVRFAGSEPNYVFSQGVG